MYESHQQSSLETSEGVQSTCTNPEDDCDAEKSAESVPIILALSHYPIDKLRK